MNGQNPFSINFQDQQPSDLRGLAGLVDQYAEIRDSRVNDQPANQFASQTPGDPSQPGRIDQSSFQNQGMGEVEDMDALSMLMANIAKRFGG